MHPRCLNVQVNSKSEKLARAEETNAELSRLLTAERKAAKLAGAAAQKQLLGSMRRIQYMVSVMICIMFDCLLSAPMHLSVCKTPLWLCRRPQHDCIGVSLCHSEGREVQRHAIWRHVYNATVIACVSSNHLKSVGSCCNLV